MSSYTIKCATTHKKGTIHIKPYTLVLQYTAQEQATARDLEILVQGTAVQAYIRLQTDMYIQPLLRYLAHI